MKVIKTNMVCSDCGLVSPKHVNVVVNKHNGKEAVLCAACEEKANVFAFAHNALKGA